MHPSIAVTIRVPFSFASTRVSTSFESYQLTSSLDIQGPECQKWRTWQTGVSASCCITRSNLSTFRSFLVRLDRSSKSKMGSARHWHRHLWRSFRDWYRQHAYLRRRLLWKPRRFGHRSCVFSAGSLWFCAASVRARSVSCAWLRLGK